MNAISFIVNLKEWLIPVSTFVTLITVSVGAWQSLREYRLKLKAETRLADSTKAETDIKLVKQFTELTAIAHGRKSDYLSEKIVEKLFENKLFTLEELNEPYLLNKKITDTAVITIACGAAEQDAFIAAIATLGMKHKILRQPAIQALESMQSFKPDVINKYLISLQE